MDEIHKFSKKKKQLSKWIKVERESMNNLVTIREIESILKKKPFYKENLELDGFHSKFYLSFKEEMLPIFQKLFQRIEKGGVLPI